MTIIAQKALRLDKTLQVALEQPRNQVEHFIKEIGVTVNGKLTHKSGLKLKGGEEIILEFPEMEASTPQEIDFDIDIIYEDDDVLVLNKPPYLIIHPAASVKEPTLVDWLKHRIKMAIKETGRASKSAFAKLALSQKSGHELIAAKLFTGRTHQIRVHLESLSRHILADKLYGFKSKKDTIPRVMLHARILYFHHPRTGELIIKEAPLFKDFETILTDEFNQEEIDEKINRDYIIGRFTNIL